MLAKACPLASAGGVKINRPCAMSIAKSDWPTDTGMPLSVNAPTRGRRGDRNQRHGHAIGIRQTEISQAKRIGHIFALSLFAPK